MLNEKRAADIMENGNEKDSNGFEDVKPKISIDMVPQLLWRLYGFQATDIKQLPSYDDLNFFFKVHKHDNKFVEDIDDNGYVLKVLNAAESKKDFIMDGHHAMVKYIRERGIPTQKPVMNLKQQEWSLETVNSCDTKTAYGPYIVRVVTFLPGTIFYETPYVAGSFYNVGKFVGRLHNAMIGFHHKFFDNNDLLWNLKNLHQLSDFLYVLKDSLDRKVVEEVMQAFNKDVLQNLNKFRRSIIHGDVNDQNLLMSEVKGQTTTPSHDRIHDVVGILDFSDAVYSYTIFDVAICISYLTIECKDNDLQLYTGGHVLAGYLEEAEVDEAEMSVLKVCVCARLCQSLVMGAFNFSQHPENVYLLTTSHRGWSCLHRLWSTPADDLMARWKSVQDSYKKS